MLIRNRIGRQYQTADHALLEQHWGRENGPYQVRNLQYLRDLRPNARRVVDVGAHVGSNTIEYATWAGRVDAFEPTPRTYEMLEQNIKWNQAHTPQGRYYDLATKTYGHWPEQPDGWYRLSDGTFASLAMTAPITLHCCALSDHPGQAYLNLDNGDLANYITPVNALFDLPGEQVPVETIDQHGWQDVDIIKIDVEGHEWSVVQGAQMTIQLTRPVVQVEMWGWERRFGINNQHMLDWFRGQGYRYTNNRGQDLPWDLTGRLPRTMDRFFVPV